MLTLAAAIVAAVAAVAQVVLSAMILREMWRNRT